MNLSKILVSVNIAATLPIAVQVSAQANPNTPEAGSLKESTLSVNSGAVSRAAQVSVAKQNFSLNKISSAPVEIDGVKLRAFMPGRRLPKSSELQTKLVSQQAQLAPETQSSLNGSVTESCTRSTYGETAANPYFSTTPRVVLNQVQAVARQLKNAKKRPQVANNIRPTSIAPQTASKPLSTTADFGQFSKDIPASWMANDKNLALIETPTASPQDMAQINQMVEQSKAQEQGTAGPPPFPLNLLPQQSLKQFVGQTVAAGRPQQKLAPQAGFGSWHGQGMPSRLTAGLAPAGFHSNLRGGHFGSYITPHGGHKVATVKSSNKNVLLADAQTHHGAIPGAKVASYAPYATGAY
ncbi:MAG TPA: hypothetical protein V6C86_20955 [Oculatellaceae cyanobacterium]